MKKDKENQHGKISQKLLKILCLQNRNKRKRCTTKKKKKNGHLFDTNNNGNAN